MTNGFAKIEHRPWNGVAPHVMVFTRPDGKRLCIACRTREEAERGIDDRAFFWGKRWGDELPVLRP